MHTKEKKHFFYLFKCTLFLLDNLAIILAKRSEEEQKKAEAESGFSNSSSKVLFALIISI